jgi:hypothetical protein
VEDFVVIRDIAIYRDGGTIEFRLESHPLAGLYRLPPRWHALRPNLTRDGRELAAGSDEEARVLRLLKTWMRETLSPETATALDELGAMREWRNLPPSLEAAVPIFYIRTVLEYLSGRSAAPEQGKGEARGGALPLRPVR